MLLGSLDLGFQMRADLRVAEKHSKVLTNPVCRLGAVLLDLQTEVLS